MEGHPPRRGVQTTKRSHGAQGIEDPVPPDFQCSQANELWVADRPCRPIPKGFADWARMLDACSRQIAGWSLGRKPDTAWMLRAWRNAAKRGPGGVIHHSDQGSQYPSKSDQRACTADGRVPSTISSGDGDDHALAESGLAT